MSGTPSDMIESSPGARQRNEMKKEYQRMSMEKNLKIREYDQRIREQNKRRINNKQHPLIAPAVKKRPPKNVKVIRATPVARRTARAQSTPNFKRNNKTTKTPDNRPQSVQRQPYPKGKENENSMNTGKKYEYGNPAVLSWMKKQRRLRALKQKKMEENKNQEMQKRREYISNLNKRQKDRAKRVKQKYKTKKMQPQSRPKMVFDSAEQSDDTHTELAELKEITLQHPANNIFRDMHTETITLNNTLLPDPSPSLLIPAIEKTVESQVSDRRISAEPSNHSSPTCKSSGSGTVPNQSLSDIPTSPATAPEQVSPDRSSSALTDTEGNPDPKLLMKIYQCIQQTRSSQSSPIRRGTFPLPSDKAAPRRRRKDPQKRRVPRRKTKIRKSTGIHKGKGKKRVSKVKSLKSLKEGPVKAEILQTSSSGKKAQSQTEDALSMEHRLIKLKDTSSKLQQRLESIAQTLSLPHTSSRRDDESKDIEHAVNHSGRDLVHTRVPNDDMTHHPNYIPPAHDQVDGNMAECNNEMNRMSTMFDELERQINDDDAAVFDYTSSLQSSHPNHESSIFNIYTNDLVFSTTEIACRSKQESSRDIYDRNIDPSLDDEDPTYDDGRPVDHYVYDHSNDEVLDILNGCSDGVRPDPVINQSEERNIKNSEETAYDDTSSKTLSTTESYTMSTTADIQESTTKIEHSIEEPPRQEVIESTTDDTDVQSVTSKLLMELELLGSMQHTASKLEKFEMDTMTEQETVIVLDQQTDDEISNLQKAKDELMITLDRVKCDIDSMEQQKQKNDKLADEHIELIKKTGNEMTKLISQTQQHLNSEHEQKHLELLKLSTNILSDHHQQSDKEKQELQQTLNIAMKLLDQYAHNLQQNQPQIQPADAAREQQVNAQRDQSKCSPEVVEQVPESDLEDKDLLPSFRTDDRLLSQLQTNKISMLDRMLNGLQGETQSDSRHEEEESAPVSKCTVSTLEQVESQTVRTGTTAYSEFENEADDQYSDDAFDALTNAKSPVSKAQQPTPIQVDSESETATEIEFDEDENEEDQFREKESVSSSDMENEIISVSDSTKDSKRANQNGEGMSVVTSATEISFDVASTIIEDDSEPERVETIEDLEKEEIETECASAIETEIESEVATEIESMVTANDDSAADIESEEEYDEVETEIMSSENAEALSTITSTLSSLAPIASASKPIIDEVIPEEVEVVPDDSVTNSAETAHSYGSSLDRMNVLSNSEKAATDSFSDTLSSILSESLSFLESSVKDSGENVTNKKVESWIDHGAAGDADDMLLLTSEDSMECRQDQIEIEAVAESKSAPATDQQEQADAVSLNIISDIVTDLFKETSTLYELRLNRASILSRQSQIEQTLDESVGIFADTTNEFEVGIDASADFIESYIEEILSHCNDMDSNSKEIDFSVFIYVETMANRREQQQIFNNLLFDTLNETLLEFKWSAKRTLRSAKRQLVQKVLEKMKQIRHCDTADDLKECFGDDQEMDDRIRAISNDFMSDYEHSREWTSSFSQFKREIKLRIADLIFQQLLNDIVSELNQMERNKSGAVPQRVPCT